MDDIQELYYLFPEIKEHIAVEKKVGQGMYIHKSFYRMFRRARKII